MQLRVGDIIGGNYRVERALSEGGMGAVYVAEQIATRKARALKVMRPELVSSVKLRERFVQEAQVGARIESEHVVEVIDAGVDAATGIPWLAMELLSGQTLAEACAPSGFSIEQLRPVFAQLCHAVSAAHDAGIVHRDLKPENIFLARSKREDSHYTVKVLDFGIAKLLDDAQTRATGAIGTPLYMPPEQMETSRHIGPEADVWALGLIAFYALTGRSFWLAGNQDHTNAMMVLREVTMLPIPTASQRAVDLGVGASVPVWFDGWFARCVAREISARFQNARQLREAFAPTMDPPAPQTAAPSSPWAAAAQKRPESETVVAEPLQLSAESTEAPRESDTNPPLAWTYLDKLIVADGTKMTGICAVTGERAKEQIVFNLSHRPPWTWGLAVLTALLLMYLPVVSLTKKSDDLAVMVVLVLAGASLVTFHRTRTTGSVMLPVGFKVLRQRSIGVLIALGGIIAWIAIAILSETLDGLVYGGVACAFFFAIAAYFRSPIRLSGMRRQYLIIGNCSPEFLKHLPNGALPPE